MAATIWLVRHGATEWSQNGRHTGSTDLPLLPEGRDRAVTLAPVLAQHEFSLVLASPLQRARETAALAGFADPVLDDDLREWDYGDYEGLTSPQIHETDPEWFLWRDGCPGGETPAQVIERCDRVIAELVTHAETGGGDAIVFAHGHILRALGARWAEQPLETGARLMLSTAAASSLGYEHSTRAIRFWNRTSQQGWN